MLRRHLTPILEAAARDYPVVTLTGPRQSGKTTLVRAVFPQHAYISLENPDHREFALEDPRGFLGQFETGVILDEVQRSPDLFSYIQGIVDEEDQAGRFVLTGSQNFLLLQSISQTLAGRCAVFHLLPLGRSELAQQRLMDIEKVGQPSRRARSGDEGLFNTLLAGGYPRIHDKQLAPQGWLANYYQTYLERDARDVLNIGDLESLGRFIRLCAGRCGQLLNLSSLAMDCGISHTTARRWMSALEASFLIYLLRPHHRNFSKRLIKSPKLYFLDSGLLCYLLGIRSPDDLRIHANRGGIFESWVVSEALKAYYHKGEVPRLYFWRDAIGHEIDLLIDRGQLLIPVEIKSGQTINEDFFKGLKYWRTLPGQTDCPAALVYGGDQSHTRRKIEVMSWRLWG